MNWGLYDSKLSATGTTARDRQELQAKEDFEREAVKNLAFHIAKRNNINQRFLINRTEVPEKYKIVAFPDEEIAVGDYIEVFNQTFIIVQVRIEDTLIKNGIMWLCNHKFKWQNFDGDLVERWGVLDSGVYSSTIRGEVKARYVDRQYKVYLPLDAETEKLYIDKRIAVDKMYDRFHNPVLNVYKITGYDATSESFGSNGHLLIINFRSDEYNKDKDNYSLMLCDYFTPGAKPTQVLSSKINGADEIRIGASRKYTPSFYNNGQAVVGVTPAWSYETLPSGITATISGNDIVISTIDDEELIGEEVELTLTDSQSQYEEYSLSIDIIGM